MPRTKVVFSRFRNKGSTELQAFVTPLILTHVLNSPYRSQVSNLFGSYLLGSNLKGSNLKGSNLKGSNLKGSNLLSSKLQQIYILLYL